jgi:anthranilate synthase/aminodeoxychorismate synthase-like glutamine amidotransferase
VKGGKIIKAPSIVHGKTSNILHDSNGIFNEIDNNYKVTRYHSLVGEINSLPNCLVITAFTQDNINSNNFLTIQAIRHKEYIIEGVQFHPESITTQYGHKLFSNFLQYKGGLWNQHNNNKLLANHHDTTNLQLMFKQIYDNITQTATNNDN